MRLFGVAGLFVAIGALSAATSAQAYTKEAATDLARQVFKTAFDDIYLFTEEANFFHDQAGMTDREFYIARGVVSGDEDYKWPTLSFDSEAAHPGTFQIDGAVRLAKTGSEPHDPIIVNEDFIVENDPFNGYQPLSFPRAVAILTHEFGHHFLQLEAEDWHETPVVGPITHEELDVLGNKVAAFMETRAQRATVGGEVDPSLANGSEIVFENYIAEAGSGQGDYNYGSQAGIYLRGPFGVVSLSNAIGKLTRCPTETFPDTNGEVFYGDPYAFYFESFQKIAATKTGTRIALTLGIPQAYMICFEPSPTPLGGPYAYFGPYKDGLLTFYFDVTPTGVTFDQHASALSITVPPDIDWH